MIQAEPHGAWTTTHLCAHIYDLGVINKTNRVAVTRALRQMKLPPLWFARRVDKPGKGYVLYNAADLESTLRRDFLSRRWRRKLDFEEWKQEYSHYAERAREDVEATLRYHNASPIERLDIDIDKLRELIGLLRSAGTDGTSAYAAKLAMRYGELIEQREALLKAETRSPQS
jgi:hypothetical protein